MNTFSQALALHAQAMAARAEADRKAWNFADEAERFANRDGAVELVRGDDGTFRLPCLLAGPGHGC